MILPVEIYGSAVLRKKSEDIDKDFPDLQGLIQNMYETMYKSDGIGLAAPQIGKNIRLIIIDLTPTADDDDNKYKDFKKTFINMKILNTSGKDYDFNEGCLSLPGIREDVRRPEEVEIEYYDENWEYHKEKFTDLPARVIQHEYDHLEGKLFVDHLPVLSRKLINRKLNNIAKGKVSVNYKVRIPK
jgi:peptide deformylase